MKYRLRHLLIVGVIFFAAFRARAELVDFDYDARSTLEHLGTKFIVGCAVIALGIVTAAIISRKK
jgi:hypothetical protein